MDKIKQFLGDMGALLLILLTAIGGLMLVLICQVWFWVAVIAITLIVTRT